MNHPHWKACPQVLSCLLFPLALTFEENQDTIMKGPIMIHLLYASPQATSNLPGVINKLINKNVESTPTIR